jgi:hypothetical protein
MVSEYIWRFEVAREADGNAAINDIVWKTVTIDKTAHVYSHQVQWQDNFPLNDTSIAYEQLMKQSEFIQPSPDGLKILLMKKILRNRWRKINA